MFLVELTQDVYGNRAYTNSKARVIEVEIEPDHTGRNRYRVIEPVSFQWPTLAMHPWAWAEVEGPARELSEDEHLALMVDIAKSNERLAAILEERIE